MGREYLTEKQKYSKFLKAKKRAAKITAIFDKEFAKYTQDEIVAMLKAADIAHERVRGTYELINDPQALANNYIYEVEHANGQKTFVPSNPVKIGNIEVNKTMDAPVLGEHTSEILKELGYEEKEITALMEKNVIVQRTRKQA